jgi:transposase
MIRIHKYALQPTSTQSIILDDAGRISKFLWNKLCHLTFYAISECKNGRRSTIINEYIELLINKKCTGQRAPKVDEIMKRDGINKKDANIQYGKEKALKDIIIPRRKENNSRCLRYSNIHLSRLYAEEKINSQINNFIKKGSNDIWRGIVQKWKNFCEEWEKGKKGSPKHKKYGQISAIQKQIKKDEKYNFGEYVDLSWCGSDCLEKVKVNYHRPLPAPSKIKQIALTKNSVNQWFVCVFIEANEKVFQKDFPKTGEIIGIDPGMKSALTTSSGEIIQPQRISKQIYWERKLKKLQRHLDRQRRLNNPHCYDENGVRKRGKKIKIIRSKEMLKTALKIAEIIRYFKDAKADYYHNGVIKLLNEYDVIGVGDAKIHNLVKGKGKAKRSQNLKIREHSISQFKSILKDKASLSINPKQMIEINEKYTTRMCNNCEYIKNDLTLNDRSWVCPNCNTNHNRDVNAAINIKNKTIKILMAEAQSVNNEKSLKVNNITKTKPQGDVRVIETISPRGDGSRTEALSSNQVITQATVGARTLQMPVTECVMKVSISADSVSPPEMVGCSQSQPVTIINQQLTTQKYGDCCSS